MHCTLKAYSQATYCFVEIVVVVFFVVVVLKHLHRSTFSCSRKFLEIMQSQEVIIGLLKWIQGPAE